MNRYVVLACDAAGPKQEQGAIVVHFSPGDAFAERDELAGVVIPGEQWRVFELRLFEGLGGMTQ
jgi:hypothetical protein